MAATNARDVRATFGYKVDTNSIQQAVAGNNAVKASLTSTAEAANSSKLQFANEAEAVRILGANIVALNPGLVATATQTNQVASATGVAVIKEKELAAATALVTAETTKQAGAFNLMGARQIAGQAGGLLAITGNSQAGSAVASVLGLTSTLGPLGIAAGLAVVGIKAVTDAEAARAKGAEDAAQRLQQLATGAAGGTTESINEQIAQQQRQGRVLQEVQDQLSAASDRVEILNFAYQQGAFSAEEYQKRLAAIGAEVNDLTGGAVTAAGGVLDLNLLLGRNKTSIDEVKGNVALLNTQLHTSAVEFNDAQAAAEEWAKGFKASVKEGLESTIKNVIDFFDAAAAARAQTLGSQTDAYFTSLTNEGSAREALTKLANEQTAAEAENAAKRIAITDDGEAKRAEIQATAAEQRAKIDQQDADARAKIQRDFNRSYGDAVANRDALGALKARQTRDDQMSDQQKGYDKAQAELDKATQKQLDTLAKAQQTQLRQLDAAVQKEQQARAQAQQRAQADLQNALASERAIAQNGQQLRLIAEFNHQNDLIDLAYNTGVAIKANALNVVEYVNSLANTVRANPLTGGAGGGGQTGGGGGGTHPLYSDLGTGTLFLNAGTGFGGGRGAALPTYASGSRYISHDQLAVVHQGERVLSAQENRAGGMSVNVYMTQAVDESSVDKLWPPIRRKIISAMRTSP